ncbi:MAG: hypothetical protein V4813_13945 [Gemmatimonadota bacterium]
MSPSQRRWLVLTRALVSCLPAIGPVARLGAQGTSGGATSDVRAGWQYGIGVGGEWNSNLQLAPSGAADGLTTARLRAEGSRIWETRRDRVALTAGGALIRVPERPEFNRESYDVGVSGLRRFSRRASASAAARAQQELTNRAITSFGDGALLPGYLIARSQEGSSNIAYALSTRTTAAAAVGAQRVWIEGGQVSRGQRATAAATISHRQSRRTTVGAQLGYQRSELDSIAIRIPDVTGRLEHQLAERLSVNLIAGASRLASGQQDAATFLTGASSIRYRSAEGDVALNAQRTVGQEFGRQTAAAQITNGVSLILSRRLGIGWRLSGDLTQQWSQSTAADRATVRSTIGSLLAGYAMRSGPRFDVTAFAARRSAAFRSQAYGVSAGVTYSWASLQQQSASGGR